jgi:DnaK suppressor protein
MALLRERRRLLGHARPPRDPLNPDVLDAAKDLEEERLWLAVSERREEVHTQIEEAVRLLMEGRHGRCVDCNMVIPPVRLRSLPFAIRCLACQDRMERRKGSMDSRLPFA